MHSEIMKQDRFTGCQGSLAMADGPIGFQNVYMSDASRRYKVELVLPMHLQGASQPYMADAPQGGRVHFTWLIHQQKHFI